VAERSRELSQTPLEGRFDIAHLRANHRHLFADPAPPRIISANSTLCIPSAKATAGRSASSFRGDISKLAAIIRDNLHPLEPDISTRAPSPKKPTEPNGPD